MANPYLNQFLFSYHKMAVELDCNFIVDPANGNGLGVRSLKGRGIANVFMNTTAAFTGTYNDSVNVTGIASGTSSLVVGMPVQGTGIPAGTTIASIVSSGAITLSAATTGGATTGSITYQGLGVGGPANPNPNPAAGAIMVQLSDSYYHYFWGTSGFDAPVSGTPISISGSSVLTIGKTYVIVSVGTTTTAQWVVAGLPVGATPAVGVAFVAAIAGGGSGTGIVEAVTNAGVDRIELVGDPNQTINVAPNPNSGIFPYYMLQAVLTTTLTAPNPNTTIGLTSVLSNSSVIINGS